MGLSCSCGEWDGEGVGSYPPETYTLKGWSSKRSRCTSCDKLINTGEVVGNIGRAQYDEDGDEQFLVDKHICEECLDIFFNLEDLGFCVNPYENMHELLKDYKSDYLPEPKSIIELK